MEADIKSPRFETALSYSSTSRVDTDLATSINDMEVAATPNRRLTTGGETTGNNFNGLNDLFISKPASSRLAVHSRREEMSFITRLLSVTKAYLDKLI